MRKVISLTLYVWLLWRKLQNMFNEHNWCLLQRNPRCKWVPVLVLVLTFRTRSWSSITPRSLPAAWAILFPATRFPTITEAGPTPTTGCQPDQWDGNDTAPVRSVGLFRLPGCFWRGFGRFVTHVCGHMRMLQGCRLPSRNNCLASEMWMPPRGVLGSVLAGTRARQYRPTWWMLSMAWSQDQMWGTVNTF